MKIKKIITLISILFCFTICIGCDDEIISDSSDYLNVDEIELETGIFYNKNWEQDVGTYTDDAIPSKEAAISMASVVFANMHKHPDAENFIPQAVFYDTEDKIWVVPFWGKDDIEHGIVGYDCSIAMRKSDGKIMRIWYGE